MIHRRLWLLLLPLLGLSLWFNWRAFRQSGAGTPGQNSSLPAVPPAAVPAGPVLPEAIDFTGTGLDDGAWKLGPAAPPDTVPDNIPGEGLPEAPVPPAEWNPDLRLGPGRPSGP